MMNRRQFNAALIGAAATAALPRDLFAALRVDVPRVNGGRLNAHLTELSRFGRNAVGGVSRVAYSDADREARAYVMELMRAAKLEPTIDAAGNIIGRRAGQDASLRPMLVGSHIDSVPEGGNFDGQVGSMGAIEVAQTLSEHSIVTRHPLEVVIWQNEEGGLYGSRSVSGDVNPRELANVSRSGKTIAEGIAFLGGDVAKLAEVRRMPGSIAGYLELHIEQGGTLARDRVNIGVVDGIVGINQWEVTVTGFSNHAGTTAMNARRDALLAAARFVELVNRTVISIPGRQVGTVGRIQAFPGAPNVVPGKVVCTLELRDLDAKKIMMVYRRIVAGAEKIARDTGTSFAYQDIHTDIPAVTDPRFRAVIARSAKELELTTRQLPSGAGHDAQAMARIGPTGMIFVPSQEGISHSPRELSTAGDITNGANVLLRSLLALDSQLG
ncbi:MAG: Zn-dependent hydrolase [Gemmatimonadaceae bacterium]|nr:Zn-dependent hydrolase [Gemmatimonadaceae bacterium]